VVGEESGRTPDLTHKNEITYVPASLLYFHLMQTVKKRVAPSERILPTGIHSFPFSVQLPLFGINGQKLRQSFTVYISDDVVWVKYEVVAIVKWGNNKCIQTTRPITYNRGVALAKRRIYLEERTEVHSLIRGSGFQNTCCFS